MSEPVTLFDLLARGVPWPVAIEALASVRLDHDDRARTIALDDEPPSP
jgi:hypothetical protein